MYYFILPVQVKTGQAIRFFHCGQETADSLEQPALKYTTQYAVNIETHGIRPC